MEIETTNLKNHLHLFVGGFEKIGTQEIIDLVSGFITISDLSRLLETNFVSEYIHIENNVREKLLALVSISDKVYELSGNNIYTTKKWLMNPNHLFFNLSPFQMILGGKADVVLQKISEWAGDEK
jgi:hypothetical protein